VVSSTPRPRFNPGKDPVPILLEAGWAPGPVWRGGKSRPHKGFDSETSNSQSVYRLSYRATAICRWDNKMKTALGDEVSEEDKGWFRRLKLLEKCRTTVQMKDISRIL